MRVSDEINVYIYIYIHVVLSDIIQSIVASLLLIYTLANTAMPWPIIAQGRSQHTLGQHLTKTRCSVNIPLQLSSLHNVQNPCSQLTCFLKSTIVAKQSPFLEGLKLFLKYFDKTTHQRMLLAPGIDQLLDKQVKSKAYSTHTYIYNVYVKHIVT